MAVAYTNSYRNKIFLSVCKMRMKIPFEFLYVIFNGGITSESFYFGGFLKEMYQISITNFYNVKKLEASDLARFLRKRPK